MLTLYAIASKFVLPYMIIILAHKCVRFSSLFAAGDVL